MDVQQSGRQGRVVRPSEEFEQISNHTVASHLTPLDIWIVSVT